MRRAARDRISADGSRRAVEAAVGEEAGFGFGFLVGAQLGAGPLIRKSSCARTGSRFMGVVVCVCVSSQRVYAYLL